jgi:acyl-CoA reductase-like NAD-dependent aldehyde dehydrogenase
MRHVQLCINGKWCDGDGTFTSFDPSTGANLAIVSKANDDDIRRAITAARGSLAAWRGRSIGERAAILERVVARLRKEYGEPGEPTTLKQLLRDEVGKRLAEADIEVVESSDMLEFFAQEGPQLLADKSLSLNKALWPSKRSHVRFEARGVVAVIKPWNYPLELPIWAIGPALLAGNTVIFKPSEHSSLVGAELVKFFLEAGVPNGVLNFLSGDETTGRSLVRAEGIDMVSFTGSRAAGQEISSECGQRLRRCALELSGNDPAIVLADVDIELASNGLLWGSFANAGQVCVRPKRILMDRAVAPKLIARLVEKTAALRPDVDFGPLISEHQLRAVDQQVAQAVREGAKLLAGGRRLPDRTGYFYEPTILVSVPQSSILMREECFGPVMPILEFDSLDQAIAMANAGDYGLGASIWSNDLQRARETADTIQAGMVWVNDVNVAFPQAPWGGVKQSGQGTELGEWGLYEFVSPKHINVEEGKSQRRDWWFPYS